MKCSFPWIIFLHLPLDLLLCAEEFRARCSIPCGVTRGQSRGAQLLPLTCSFWCSPGYDWLSESASAHCWLMYSFSSNSSLCSFSAGLLLTPLQLAVLLFQEMLRWLKSSSRKRAFEPGGSCSWRRKAPSVNHPYLAACDRHQPQSSLCCHSPILAQCHIHCFGSVTLQSISARLCSHSNQD